MYEAFFGLQKRPFAATPDPECFVPVGDAQSVLDDLVQCVRESRGIGVVSAAAGLGKTLLCRKLARDLEPEYAVVWLPTCSFPSRRALLQAMLYELGHPYARLSESELRLALASAAKAGRPERRGVLILIDEAHRLTERLLEELRGLTNHLDGGHALFHVVLSGQLELDERLAASPLEAFRQRIGCQTTIQPLTSSDSVKYVAQRLAWCGVSLADVLSPEAAQLIAHASDGSPRCLNQLADQSLLLGYVAEQKPVGVDVVHQALDDLRQLPLNWNAPSRLTAFAEDAAERTADDAPFEESDEQDIEAAAVETPPAQVGDVESADRRVTPSVSAFGDDLGEFAAIEIGASKDGEPMPEQTPSTSEAQTEPVSPNAAEPGRADDVEIWSSVETPAAASTFATVESSTTAFESLPFEELTEILSSELTEPAGNLPSVDGSVTAPAVEKTADVPPATEPPPPERRSRRKPRGPRQPISFDEEVVVDRYALLDAGKPIDQVPAEPAYAVSSDWHDDDPPRQPRPDELIDRIIPMIDAALSLSGGPLPTETAPDNIPRSLHREVRNPRPSGGARDDEREVGAAVLEQCLETQRELTTRLGAVERDQFEAGMRAMTEEELRPDAPLPNAAVVEQPVATVAPLPEPARSDAVHEESAVAPMSDAAPVKKYSQLFSALRKKQKRPA